MRKLSMTKRLNEARERLELGQLKMADAALRQLRESIPSCGRDNDEDQWSLLATGRPYYTETDIQDLQQQAVKMYYEVPLARGIIETLVNFVVGKDCKIIPASPLDEVCEFWDEFQKINDFDLRGKEGVRRAFRDGELFLRKFDSPEPKGVPLVRYNNPDEFRSPDGSGLKTYGIETDPGDIEKPVKYYREFTRPDGTAGKEEIDAAEMIHFKIGVDGNNKRGLSILLGIAPYIIRYKNWLDDRIMVNKLRTRFNLVADISGTGATDTIANKFPGARGTDAAGNTKRKMPKQGSLIATKGIKWDFKSLNINAADTKDDGRAILLMIATGVGLSEIMVTGNAENANLASSMIAEAPAVRTLEAHQDTFEKFFKSVFKMAIEHGIRVGRIPATHQEKQMIVNIETGAAESAIVTVETSTDCMVSFPTLIHHDIKADTDSLILAYQNEWASKRTCQVRLNFDPEEEDEQIAKEKGQMQEPEGYVESPTKEPV